MKKKICGLLAIFLLIPHGGGTELLAAARTKNKAQMPTSPAGAAAAPVAEILGVAWEGSQLKISLSQLIPFKTFLLQDPPRLVIELPGIPNKSLPAVQQMSGSIVQQVHVSEQGQGSSAASRIVLDLSEPADFEAHPSGTDILVTLKPNPASKSTLKGSAGGRPDLLGNLPNDPIDLDFEGEDVRSALRLLGELSGINIIYAADVGGSFTLHLKQVPFNQAFQTVLSMNALVARQLGDNILWIMTPASLAQNRNNAQLETRTFVLNYAKADQIKNNLDLIRSTAGRKGITATDPRTNTLTLMDTPEGLEESERLISVFDKKPIQVLIEARIVEVSLGDSLDLGIQWALAYGNRGSTNNYGFGTTQLNTTPANSLNKPSAVTDGIVTGTPGAFVNPAAIGGASPATGVSLPAAATAGAISFGFVNNTTSLLAALNAMAQKNKSRILSAPKVVTLNSEDARIEASQQIPFPITTVTGTGISQQSFQFVSAGIILTVTPTVNSKGQVTLKINPVVSFPVAGLTTVGPTIRNRSAQTTVIVDDGQTVVIGGLIDESDTKNIQKVPLLGDIPVLGTFFRRRFTEKRRTELLVFVTPRIIKD